MYTHTRKRIWIALLVGMIINMLTCVVTVWIGANDVSGNISADNVLLTVSFTTMLLGVAFAIALIAFD